ncbi:glycosyltransferase BC10-like [Mangifera indica]|uniref:glycosyltransferase BC10-like n=1 Tax=Mangifera indica TaxID=29780 RepID=UPI001CFA8BE3|nr:glycosyltransferase BC10-like [Mangifera indica]XP_044471137.1 glycosyltransferase BC10-like [Mangifera indica]
MALTTRDLLAMSGSRQQRAHLKRPIWIIFFVSLVVLFLIGAYVVFPSRSFTACYFFSSKDCTMFDQPPSPPARELTVLDEPLSFPARELTDDENIAWAVMNELVKKPPAPSKNPKIAFLFMTPGALPFEKLWEKFYQGHEDRFSVYVHASSQKPVHMSRYFVGRDIHSEKVARGKISMLEAEKRLLAHALLDPDNQQFVLLSDSCVPLHNFDYVYNYLMYTNISYIDCFEDPGPHGNGRYSEHMLPEVEKKDFRKGSQWFSMKRQHAIIIMVDNLFYTKFKLYCKPNMNGRNCYAEEHYLPTLFHMIDPSGIANWSVTHVDWSEGRWHPKAYRAQDVTIELLKSIASIDETVHVTSNEKKEKTVQHCLWNGTKRPCYLFARTFFPETLDRLTLLLNYTTV